MKAGFQTSSKCWDSPELLTSFFLLAFVNGEYSRVSIFVNQFGILEGVLSTFGISIVIFVAMYLVVQEAWSTSIGHLGRLDVAVLGLALGTVILPVSGLSWIGLSGVSLWFLFTRRGKPDSTRMFTLVLALCVSNFWARLIARLFMPIILRFDTALVALLSGSDFSQNYIVARDGATVLEVMEGCSSFNNMSLALLAWASARFFYRTHGISRSIVFVCLSAVVVVFINSVRIAMIAFWPAHYDLLHGNAGASIANVLTSLSVAGIAAYGARK